MYIFWSKATNYPHINTPEGENDNLQLKIVIFTLKGVFMGVIRHLFDQKLYNFPVFDQK